MTQDPRARTPLADKDEIRDLVLTYCRAIDRQDLALCRSLYADDAWDRHGDVFDGSADEFIKWLEQGLAYVRHAAHYICNHLITVNGDEAEGEAYALAYHILPDGKGGLYEDFRHVRYLDAYRREKGRWLFAHRYVTFDWQTDTPLDRPEGEVPDQTADASYQQLNSRLFARGARA